MFPEKKLVALNSYSMLRLYKTHDSRIRSHAQHQGFDGSEGSSNPQCRVQAIIEIPTLASTTNKLYSQKDLNSAIKCAKAISIATS